MPRNKSPIGRVIDSHDAYRKPNGGKYKLPFFSFLFPARKKQLVEQVNQSWMDHASQKVPPSAPYIATKEYREQWRKKLVGATDTMQKPPPNPHRSRNKNPTVSPPIPNLSSIIESSSATVSTASSTRSSSSTAMARDKKMQTWSGYIHEGKDPKDILKIGRRSPANLKIPLEQKANSGKKKGKKSTAQIKFSPSISTGSRSTQKRSNTKKSRKPSSRFI